MANNISITTNAKWVELVKIENGVTDRFVTNLTAPVLPTGDPQSIQIMPPGQNVRMINQGDAITIDGTVYTPPDSPSFLRKMNEVFRLANSGSGGSGGTVTTAAIRFAPSKSAADALARISGTFVRVENDETQANQRSMYVDNGTSLELQYFLVA